MAKNKQLTKTRITTWILAFVMLLSACTLIFTACGKSSTDDESEDDKKKTDTQTFANADFEYFEDSDGSYMIATPDSWTKAADSNSSGSSASSSTAKSGTVDTSVNWGEKYLYARNTYEEYKDEDDEDKLPEEYYTDIDNDYDIPGWDLAKAAYDKNEENEEDFTLDNLKAEDIDKVNPGTPFKKAGEEDKDNGTHVLMVHNYRTNEYGTATKYTATSITLAANTSAKFSVWVKTYGMSYAEGETVNGDRGAFIRVTNTVGGASQDPLTIKNIDTEKLNPEGQNNGWVQYTVYLKASSYATTTFNVVLGLGEQVESATANKYGYVQGYAFFDALTYEVLTNEEYATQTAALPDSVKTELNLFSSDDSKKFDAVSDANKTNRAFALDLDVLKTDTQTLTLNNVKVNGTTEKQDGIAYGIDKYLGNAAENLKDANDASRSGMTTASNVADGNYPASVQKAFKNYPFNNENLLMIYSGKGAPYTTEVTNSNLTSNLFEVGKDESLLISFWVKTSEMNGGTGATINLVNYETKNTIGAVDTTTLDTVDLKDDRGTVKEDLFDGWQQCYFFVTNDTDSSITFTMQFSFGPTTLSGTTLSSYSDGFAAFANFAYTSLEEEELNIVSTGSYAVKATLAEDADNADSSVVFDTPAYTGSTEGNSDIEKGFADLANYNGVYGDSKYVGGDSYTTDPEKNQINSYENAGLINKKYATNYNGQPWLTCVLENYSSITDALNPGNDWWSTVFGNNCTQPLLIVNPDTVSDAYGFIGKSTSISTSSYTTVSVRVKLSANATAYVYLIDTTEPEDENEVMYKNGLSYSAGVSYRYDENGNVVLKDPEADDFNEDTDILFYKQDNGLWADSENYTGSDFYANLANYEKDKDGNLTDGNDNIIYYLHNDTYYRYYDEEKETYSVAVKDFTSYSDADKVAQATLQNLTNKDKVLVQKIEGTPENANKWIYVNFYIANGSVEAKNYRLEVWNGSRDNTDKMEAASYVAFDGVTYDALTADTFNALIEEGMESLGKKGNFADGKTYNTVKEIQDAYNASPDSFITETENKASLVYYHFSLFDDKAYAPYDKDYDEDETGDPYADYTASSYSDTVAYLRFDSSLADNKTGVIEYNTFVNYGASEISVAISTDDGEEETTTPSDTNNVNLWLLIPSIALAAALFFTLITMLVKKLLANIKRNKVRYTPQYNAKRKRYIRKLRLEESEQDEDATAPDVLPDEDEITEEDIYKVESEDQSESTENSDPEKTDEEK